MVDRIELVYFPGCAHVDAARENLRRAMATLGRPEGWAEVDLDSGAVPPHLHALPSPTILVDGRDVSGAGDAAVGRCCRRRGAPSTEAILDALRAAG